MKIGKPTIAKVELNTQERVILEQAAILLKEYCDQFQIYPDCKKLCPLYACCAHAKNQDSSYPNVPKLLADFLKVDELYVPLNNN